VTTIYVRHPIANYARWRRAFDEHEPKRREFGITVRRVQRNVDRPLEIILVLEAADLERAREFTESADLRKAMILAGVLGRPEVWFAEDIG
jgi:hypothetical protein